MKKLTPLCENLRDLRDIPRLVARRFRGFTQIDIVVSENLRDLRDTPRLVSRRFRRFTQIDIFVSKNLRDLRDIPRQVPADFGDLRRLQTPSARICAICGKPFYHFTNNFLLTFLKLFTYDRKRNFLQNPRCDIQVI